MVYVSRIIYICAMKRFALLLFCALLQPCVYSQRWQPVFQPFDSLVLLYDRGQGIASACRQARLLDRMDSISSARPELPALAWRRLYFKSLYLYHHFGQRDEALRLLGEARRLVDRERYPYDEARIGFLRLLIENTRSDDALERYKRHKRRIAYYEKVGDTLMLANTYVMLGRMLGNLNHTAEMLDYLSRAERLYRSRGLEEHALRNRLNIADVLCRTGERERGLQMMDSLLSYPGLTERDTSFTMDVLESLAYNGDEEASRRYYDLARLQGGNLRQAAAASFCRAPFLLERGEADSALSLYRTVQRYLLQRPDNEMETKVLEGLARTFMLRRQWDSAACYFDRSCRLRDSLARIDIPEKIHQMENRAEIGRYEADLRQAVEKSRFHRVISILVIALAVCVVTAVSYIFHIKRRKTKLQHEQIKLQMQLQDRELTASSLMLAGKTNALSNLLERLAAHEENGGIDKRVVQELKSQIRAHFGTQDEWQTFRMQFEKVHPDFFTRLKQLVPTLTEGELRLCAYIRTGMENKQIAQMLARQPNSVKMARYRIRKKLALASGDSLEDFLRNFDRNAKGKEG